jgi:hypothetical protein
MNYFSNRFNSFYTRFYQDLVLKLNDKDGRVLRSGATITIKNISHTLELGKAKKIELTVKARNLPKNDILSKSDPVPASCNKSAPHSA